MNGISNHLRSNVVGYVAVFIALGGTAYAIDGPLAGQDTVGSADIIDDEVQSRDVRDDSLDNGGLRDVDLRPDSVRSSEIDDGQVLSAEVRNDTLADGGLAATDLRPGSVRGSEVRNNSLTGADIDEAALSGVYAAAIANPTQVAPAQSGTSQGSPTSLTLSGDSWTVREGAFQVGLMANNLISGINISPPATCSGPSPALHIDYVNQNFGVTIAHGVIPYTPGAQLTTHDPIVIRNPVAGELAVDWDVRIWDSCTGADERWTLDNMSWLVIGAR